MKEGTTWCQGTFQAHGRVADEVRGFPLGVFTSEVAELRETEC